MEIISKYNSTCRNCQGVILAGDKIDWERGKGSAHLACPAAPVVTGKTTTVVNRRGLLDPVGAIVETARVSGQKTRAEFGDWLFVVSAKKVKEYDDDDDRMVTRGVMTCRAATAEEAASQIAAAAIEAKKYAAKKELLRLANQVAESGTKPENCNWPNGTEIILDPSRRSLVLAEGNVVWSLTHNGNDGDDWRPNNCGGWIAYQLTDPTLYLKAQDLAKEAS